MTIVFKWAKFSLFLLAFFISAYVVTAYEFLPSGWRIVERRHPAIDAMGTRALTKDGIPGDPLNVCFVGSMDELIKLFHLAGWQPADAVTFQSSLKIALASAAHKSYPSAPVSPLFVNGKMQDLSFERAEGVDPSKRHHVRFWNSSKLDFADRQLWIGAATFDRSIGLSRTTGQITHHIAPKIDQERDQLIKDLQAVVGLSVQWIDNFQDNRAGKNGGGDEYETDQRLAVFSLRKGINDSSQ